MTRCFYCFFSYFYFPRSIVPATGSRRKDTGKSPDPAGKHGKYPKHGSSIPAWNFPMISGQILPESTGSSWNPSGNSRPEYCFQLPSIFRCIPPYIVHLGYYPTTIKLKRCFAFFPCHFLSLIDSFVFDPLVGGEISYELVPFF